jgi:hypothetical protein
MAIFGRPLAELAPINRQSKIENQQCHEWLTRPGSQQLGAKWVEVNGGVRSGQSQGGRIENVASNTR